MSLKLLLKVYSKVNNVKCPLWSEDNPYKFLTIINLAFESNYVSFNINNWISISIYYASDC